MNTTPHPIARLISIISTPPLVLTLFLVYLMFHFAQSSKEAAEWLIIGFLFLAFIPSAYVFYLAKNDRIHGFHMFRKEERIRPMLLAFGSVLTALILFSWLGAEKPIIAFLAAGVINIVVFTLITKFWKISIHTGTLTAVLTTVLIYSYGKYLWLWLLLVPVAYARLITHSHTWSQILVGIAIGGGITALTLYLFGYWFF